MIVSIVVITYNSEKTVLNTLVSIENQLYNEIELIISDDCSKDKTIEICNNWLKLHEKRFVKSTFLSSSINTGISLNLNRAIEHVSGEWIKIIAGDDMLLPNCISDNIHFVSRNDEAKVVFSNQQSFSMVDGKIVLGSEFGKKNLLSFGELTAKEQYLSLLESNKLPASTAFIKKTIFKENVYNPLYKYMEDIPMWINLTKKGVKIFCFETSTVLYRIDESLSHTSNSYFSERLFESERLFFELERGPYMLEEGLKNTYIKYKKIFLLMELRLALLGNRRSFFHDIISVIIKYIVFIFAKYSG